MRATVISLILSLGVWHCVGPVRRWNGNDAARVRVARTHTRIKKRSVPGGRECPRRRFRPPMIILDQ